MTEPEARSGLPGESGQTGSPWRSSEIPSPYEATVTDVEDAFGRHDGCQGRWEHNYALPPHNTPDDPRDSEGAGPCQTQCYDVTCEHERRYEVVIYQIGTHEWVRLYACVPCTASLRRRHARLGPRGTQGISRIREVVNA